MEIQQLKALIEQLMNDGAYNRVVELFEDDTNLTYVGKDYTLYVMSILSQVYKIEKDNGVEQGFLDGRSVNESVELYQKSVLLLRRLEFDFPMEFQMELLEFITSNHISGVAIWAIIQGTKYLYAKDKIISRFNKLLSA